MLYTYNLYDKADPIFLWATIVREKMYVFKTDSLSYFINVHYTLYV